MQKILQEYLSKDIANIVRDYLKFAPHDYEKVLGELEGVSYLARQPSLIFANIRKEKNDAREERRLIKQGAVWDGPRIVRNDIVKGLPEFAKKYIAKWGRT